MQVWLARSSQPIAEPYSILKSPHIDESKHRTGKVSFASYRNCTATYPTLLNAIISHQRKWNRCSIVKRDSRLHRRVSEKAQDIGSGNCACIASRVSQSYRSASVCLAKRLHASETYPEPARSCCLSICRPNI